MNDADELDPPDFVVGPTGERRGRNFRLPELDGDDLGVLVATDAAAAHEASACLDNMGKGGPERL
ncbi:hypothetical protein [Rhodococcus sp. LB1]|uniref:hypothetical protein n=1 Tax=Rhodococcus sp. LB1 TaxID=1807499 RepID=UPI0018D3DEC1|nr:hypothetical protein [Rhodococcus sp. LB1]